MSKSGRSGVIRIAEAGEAIPGPAGEHSVQVLQRGSLDVRLAFGPPVSPSPQTVHQQDEVYAVVRGRGVLFHDGKHDAFQAGDLLFVAAGVEHRFEDFSPDLAVWVIFYGAQGGEIPNQASP